MVVLGLVQVVVHLICFLHMNMSSEGRWNVMAFIFMVIVILLWSVSRCGSSSAPTC